ncbi:MAG: thiamine phosphate synthase [Chitinophagales bacterium]|nr:thiamine phosphate synthase [Chitinophagales bacterium]MDW8428383.1 thiamine phosphate synthase [Chitinophagales bacterium]
MKRPFSLIVISSPDGLEQEAELVNEMFRNGLQLFHLRKPRFSTRRLASYLQQIHPAYHNKVVIHTHHELCLRFPLRGVHLNHRHKKRGALKQWLLLKYLQFRKPKLTVSTGLHSLSDLDWNQKKFSYVFLSPVFESVSKVGYKSTFNEVTLREHLPRLPYDVIALGGITEENILKTYDMGFAGAAVLGRIWKSDDPVGTFKMIREKCQQFVPLW